MKRVNNQFTILAILLITAAMLRAQDVPTKEPEELKRLRQEYQQKREAALKPITLSYQQQLEQLSKNFTQRSQLDEALAVRKELENIAATEGRQADLRDALLNWKWSWTTVAAKETDVSITFSPDGTSSHRGGRQTWTILGPREIKFVQGSNTFVLRFDQKLETYKSVSGPELHGRRIPK